jgi:hypothetical protein
VATTTDNCSYGAPVLSDLSTPTSTVSNFSFSTSSCTSVSSYADSGFFYASFVVLLVLGALLLLDFIRRVFAPSHF